MNIYARQDMYHALTKATIAQKWQFPLLMHAKRICFQARGIYDPLLKKPVPYDINLQNGNTFLLLTDANMSGKTTFMRSLGVAAFLAHIGMGTPTTELSISFLKGIVTNMYVED